MRTTTFALAFAAGFAATPAFACSMMSQAAATTTGSTAAAGAMMCGRPTTAAQAQPSVPGMQPAPAQFAAGGCSCCRNMAMMQPQPGQPGGMGTMPGMPGMPQSPTTPPAPTAPDAPKPN